MQAIDASDDRQRLARAHRHAGRNDADMLDRGRIHPTLAGEIGDHRRGENEKIGCLAGHEFVPHGADRTKAAGDLITRLQPEPVGQGLHQALRRTAAEDLHLHRRFSPLPQ